MTLEIFVLTPTVIEDGDRDGIPNVLVEARPQSRREEHVGWRQSNLASRGVNGFLTAPGDVADIETQIATLLDSPELRQQMGAAARRTVESDSSPTAAAERLEEIFLSQQTVGAAP